MQVDSFYTRYSAGLGNSGQSGRQASGLPRFVMLLLESGRTVRKVWRGMHQIGMLSKGLMAQCHLRKLNWGAKC